jgi:bifunctional non-homologous end joining protein LigD
VRKGRHQIEPGSIAGARRAALPPGIVPQFPTLVTAVPSGDQWLHEVKYDGYRIIATLARDGVRLLTRHGKDWTARFATIGAALAALVPDEALVDGEIVHQEPDGTISFAALARDLSEGRTEQFVYYVFDLLHFDGYCLTAARLEDRKRALAGLVPPDSTGPVRYSRHVVGDGSQFFAECCRRRFEGIVSKRRDAPYRSGHGRDWLKVKCVAREEFAIIGWTDPQGSREGIGSLLLGFYDGAGKLHYAGRVGTGFSGTVSRDLRRRLGELSIAAPPNAAIAAAAPRRSHWVRPELVAEVRFTEWTPERRLRHPVFLGLREDKTGHDVIINSPAAASTAGY